MGWQCIKVMYINAYRGTSYVDFFIKKPFLFTELNAFAALTRRTASAC